MYIKSKRKEILIIQLARYGMDKRNEYSLFSGTITDNLLVRHMFLSSSVDVLSTSLSTEKAQQR